MNILLVHNYYRYPGGEDIVVANEKNMLEKHGHRVVLYTKNNKDIDTSSLFKKVRLALNSVFSYQTYRDIYTLIKKENIKVVHVHNTLSLISPSVYYAAINAGAVVVQTMHNFRMLCPAGTFYRKGKICEKCLKKGMLKGIIRRCYRDSFAETAVCVFSMWFNKLFKIYKKVNYIALTEFNKRKLMCSKSIDSSKIYIKPNFVPTDDNMKELRNTVKKEDYYLYAGRLESLKGIDIIISAWKLMGENAPKLIICGNGEKEALINNAISEGKLHNIEMAGYVDQNTLHEMMAAARALIYPSQCYETFGMGIIESYCVGTPVLVSKLGNPGMLVKEGETGYKFIHDNPEDLVEKINMMQKLSDEEYSALSRKAYYCYFKNFTEEANYLKLMDIYKNLLHNKENEKRK